jgi:O-6-methylguanine DNA methyltransferase
MRDTKTFRTRVLEIVQSIPRGQTMTYGEVARRAGNAQAGRAVGAIMRANYDPSVPCHRVVRSDGGLGGYNRGEERKRVLLQGEGVKV